MAKILTTLRAPERRAVCHCPQLARCARSAPLFGGPHPTEAVADARQRPVLRRLARAAPLAALGAAFGPACPALANVPDTPIAAVEAARKLQAEGKGDAARELLSAALVAAPDSELLALAKAESYLADDNDFWALKVLQDFSASHPPACQTRTFMARVQIDQANLEEAEGVLAQPGCAQPEELHARILLLRAVVAQARDDHDAARKLVRAAARVHRRYEEDDALLRSLEAHYYPHRIPLHAWSLDLAGGWTSNGLAGSVVDRAARASHNGSMIATLDARWRMVIPTGLAVRPAAEAQLKVSQLFAESASDLSTRQPTLRAGVLLGRGPPRLLLGYAYSVVQVQAGDQYDDGPLLYSEGHRAEYELEASNAVFAFGGAGHRRFREGGRTRYEMEQGLAASFALSDSLRLMTGLSARYHRARNNAYHAVGATGLTRLTMLLPEMFEARETLSLSADRYPDSAGYFLGSNGENRNETLLQVATGVWSPSRLTIRAGLGYEYTTRRSTADAYSFSDHRFMLHLAWHSDSDHFAVSRIPTEGRVPMVHGVDTSAGQSASDLQIRDLVRQDEAVQRSSSCLK